METIKSVRVLGVKKRPRPPPYEDAADGGRPSKARRASPGTFGSSRSVIQNYRNFINSGRPRRVLFFDDSGGWQDFPEDVMLPLLDAFKALRSAVEIAMRNCSYLVDFVHMVMTDLKTGEQQSVGYIDEAEKCFFPLVCFEDGDDKLSSSDEIELKLEILIRGTDKSEPEEDKVISNAQLGEEEEVSSVIKEVIVENGTLIPNVLGFDGLGDKLVQMHRGDDGYNNVQKIFLTGLGVSVTPNNVLCIHRYVPKDGAARARLQSFEEQMQILQKHRGDANVRRGWYGTSKEGVAGILRNGFGSGKPVVGMSYGAGVYLAPERCGHVSVKFCDVDENGVQHMVLCRIIMGSMEKVQLGSEQFHPSSEDFDSGVDNIQNPRLYVIWNAHVNTRILPEYVVSFKLLPSQQEHLAGLNNVRSNVDVSMTNDEHATSTLNPVRAVQNSTPVPTHVKFPTSAWLPFSMLFDAIQTSISPSDKELLDVHYNAFKCKKITREQLIQKLRQIAGDDLLRSTLRQFQRNPPTIVQPAQQKPMQKVL
eukprot:TRINITY_DN758_c0_g1_i1.p1 TRINITY_DN758_c0_g1~~TRINITY_DN758_c0_g1_i1.p1  ORF type:complete len:535 (-),score=101.14 TRINITY_DN758_c0_g1_i1:2458-4062(-)